MDQPMFDTVVEFILTLDLEAGVVMQGASGYLAQILASAEENWESHTGVRLFARLAGVHPEKERWLPVKGWTVVAQVLVALRRLLGIKWRLLSKEWLKGRAIVSEQLVRDLVGNLYNTDAVDALEAWGSVFQPRLTAHNGADGESRAMAVDDLLEAFADRWHSGDCPRPPVLFPRRVAAGDGGDSADLVVKKGDPRVVTGIRGMDGGKGGRNTRGKDASASEEEAEEDLSWNPRGLAAVRASAKADVASETSESTR